jgi:Skp family chaperone for outer membrane proteins
MIRVCVFLFVLAMAVATPARAQSTTPAPVTPQSAPAPLPEGSRFAFVNLQVVFSESNLGKQGQDRWRAFTQKLFDGLTAKTKEIDGLSAKIKSQQNIVGQEVLMAWNKELQRLQREVEFAREDAQVQSEQLQGEVLADFEKQILPVIDTIRTERKLLAVFAVQNQSGGLTLLSAERGMDLSSEVVRRLNERK